MSNATRISVFIPEGCLKIAQRFNVGFSVRKAMSPEGTADSAVPVFVSHPFGTRVFPVALPNAEALGYSHKPLWDEVVRWCGSPNPSGIGQRCPRTHHLGGSCDSNVNVDWGGGAWSG